MEPLKSISLALFRVKEQQIKQRSHLRFTGQCWKLASLMKTMHVTCDSEVNHGTRPDGSVHGSPSHLLPRTQLFQRMLSGWQIQTFFIPFCSLYSCLTDPRPYLGVLILSPALLHPVPWLSGLPCHREPPDSFTFHSGSHFRLCPWLLGLFLSAAYHCVTLAGGVAHSLQS